MNRILYITNARIPTEKAHGYQICKMCEEYSKLGYKVELWVPRRKNSIKEDIFSYYKIKNNFAVVYISCFDFFKFDKYLNKKVIFYLQSFLYFFILSFKKPDRQAIIYTRTPEIAWLYGRKKYRVFYEAHYWPNSRIRFFKYLLRKVKLIICNSGGTASQYNGVGFKNTMVAPNGVDLDKFNVQVDAIDIKKEYGLNLDKKIIMYVGNFYKWKGVEVVVKAAELMVSRSDIEFILVGGSQADVNQYRTKAAARGIGNIIFLGQRNREEIPKLIKCADVLLLPNIPISQESIKYTSPIKMFEYMAASKPIIASALPSIKEVLNDENSLLIEPGNANNLVKAIDLIINDKALAARISSQAYKDSEQYSWQSRADKIIRFINKHGKTF